MGGEYCTSFPWVAQQRQSRPRWDGWTREATSVQKRRTGPKISRRPITTCPEAEAETPYCSPLPPPPPIHPHYLRDGLTRRAASPGSVSASLYLHTHDINKAVFVRLGQGDKDRDTLQIWTKVESFRTGAEPSLVLVVRHKSPPRRYGSFGGDQRATRGDDVGS